MLGCEKDERLDVGIRRLAEVIAGMRRELKSISLAIVDIRFLKIAKDVRTQENTSRSELISNQINRAIVSRYK